MRRLGLEYRPLLQHGAEQIAEAQASQDQDRQQDQANNVLFRTHNNRQRRRGENVAQHRSFRALPVPYKSYNCRRDKGRQAAYGDAGNWVGKPMRHLVVALAMIVGAMVFTFTAASALQTVAAVHNDSAAVR